MPKHDRQQIRRVFMEVADLPGTDRSAALAGLCHGDAELHADVEALLRSEDECRGFMGNPTSDLLGSSLPVITSSAAVTMPGALRGQEGQMIGRYKLLQ